jgi:hypothetical protein
MSGAKTVNGLAEQDRAWVVNKLKNAKEGVDTHDPSFNKNTVDVFLLASISDKTVECWLQILRDQSACKVGHHSSIGRTAILCKEKDEDRVRAAIEKTLPGLREFYETVEGPERDSYWDERSRMPASWYGEDRGCYRLLSATVTDKEIERMFGEIGVEIPIDPTWTSFQRGLVYGWASTVSLAKGPSPRMLVEIPGGITKVPDFIKQHVPDNLLDDLPTETQMDKCVRLTEYLVEANGNETQNFWRDFSLQAGRMPRYAKINPDLRVSWEQLSGMSQTIGKLDKRPVAVTVFWNRLNGHLIGFWEATSQVVDHKMIEEWLDKTFPNVPRTDSMNFTHAFRVIKPSGGGQ